MADPLSVASGVAGLVSLTIQATQLACKYVSEVSHAGETALQCLRSLSLLRDVLERIQESEKNEAVALIVNRKLDIIASSEVEKCAQNLEKVSQRLQALFHDDGKIKRRKALVWPFQSTESANLIKQLQDFRDTFATVLAANSLDISAKSHVMVSDTRNDVRAIKADVEAGLRNEAARKVLSWILAEDSEQWRLGNSRTIPVGTGSFFLDSTVFQDWLAADNGILWTHGAPGSGKSVLMAQTISHLQQSGASAAVVLSHFCDHRDPRTQSTELVMRHLIKQAALQSETVLRDLQSCSEYREATRSGRSLRKAELQRILFDVCLVKDKFVIIIDGLDECAEELDGSEARQDVMELLVVAASQHTRMLVASRHLADIDAGLGHGPKFELRAPEADLRAYVSQRLAGLEKRVPSAVSLKPAIADKIVADADGIFLLARLTLDILAPSSIKNLRQIKTFLTEKSWDLSEMYQATYSRIKSSDAASAELAQRVLIWICFAQRPLHEVELQHAIATELGDDDFDPDGITPGDLLRSSCMGLVVCDDEGAYSLFHLTAYEFFRSSPDMISDASQLLISRTCLTYLSFSSTGRQGPCDDLSALEARKSEFRLLDYAAKHAADHMQQVEEAVVEDVLLFLRDDTLRQALMQAFYHQHRDDEELRRITFESLPSGSSPLQVACGRGLVLTATELLQSGSNVTEADRQGWTPLIAATSYGHLEVVQLLLSHGNITVDAIAGDEHSCGGDSEDTKTDSVGLHTADTEGWTPLFWAVVKNQYEVAELLLMAGASVSVKDQGNWTPIDWAAFRASHMLVKLLLRYTPGARIKGPKRGKLDTYHPREFSPLFLAAAAGNHQSVEAMLEFGAQAPTTSEANVKHLFKVLYKSNASLAERQYRAGRGATLMPSLIETDDFSIKLLEAAIRFDQLTIVKMLVELGASLGAVKSEVKQRTPLHIAACCGNDRICEYLLLKGASPSLPDNDGFYPMDLAIVIGHPRCTRLFLALSPPISTLMERGIALTAFIFGLRDAGSGKLQSRKPTRGKISRDPQSPRGSLTMPNIRGPETYIRLHRTGKDYFEVKDVADVLQAFLGSGCDVDAIGQCRHSKVRIERGVTALHRACWLANLDLVSFLIASGADVNRLNDSSQSPLYTACMRSRTSQEMIQMLVQHGADVNAVDNRQLHSPLHVACETASIAVVRCLVANGAVVDAYGNDNGHPIHFVCKRGKYRSKIPADTTEIVDYILSLSHPKVLTVEWEPGHETPLHLAIQAEAWEIAELLHKRGAKITNPGPLSPTLWRYAEHAHGEHFRRLLDFGASPVGKCSTAFFYEDKTIIAHYFDEYFRKKRAVDEGFEENLVALIQAGADINARSFFSLHGSSKEVTVLQTARYIQLEDAFVQILLRHGASEVDEEQNSSDEQQTRADG